MNKISIFILFSLLLVPAFLGSSAESSETDEIILFEMWAKENGISLVGVSKSSYDLYYEGYDPKIDYVDWRDIPGVLTAANVSGSARPMYRSTCWFAT